LVLHTVWEHDVLQPHWAELINRCDAVIVPTTWNAEVFRASGICVPVIEVPHAHEEGVNEPEIAWLDAVVPDDADTLRLHSVATWSLRKSPWTTLEAYTQAFAKPDGVVLAMKTSSHLDDGVPSPPGPAHRRNLTSWSVAQIMNRNAPAPALHLITEPISFAQLAGLHHRSGGWISLPHTEGWDLGCFDAAVAGCPVITTGHGGPLAYLDPELSVLIPGRRVELDWLAGAYWIEADVDAAIDALRALRADPLAARARAERQALELRSRYAPELVASTLLSALTAAGILISR
jgi:glycosyltransferase involved in cell wall biosynthesis